MAHTQIKILPRVNSGEYMELMDKVVKAVESALNVSVYGYTNYIRISFRWLDDEGKPFGDPCSMPFSVAHRYLQLTK